MHWFYRIHARKRVLLAEKSYNELPPHHQQMIPKFRIRIQKIKEGIDENYNIIKMIVNNTDHMFENKDHGPLSVRTYDRCSYPLFYRLATDYTF